MGAKLDLARRMDAIARLVLHVFVLFVKGRTAVMEMISCTASVAHIGTASTTKMHPVLSRQDGISLLQTRCQEKSPIESHACCTCTPLAKVAHLYLHILPSGSCNDALWVPANQVLSPFIQQQQTHSKSHGQEPMLHWYRARSQHAVKLWDVEEEDCNDQREQDGRE